MWGRPNHGLDATSAPVKNNTRPAAMAARTVSSTSPEPEKRASCGGCAVPRTPAKCAARRSSAPRSARPAVPHLPAGGLVVDPANRRGEASEKKALSRPASPDGEDQIGLTTCPNPVEHRPFRTPALHCVGLVGHETTTSGTSISGTYHELRRRVRGFVRSSVMLHRPIEPDSVDDGAADEGREASALFPHPHPLAHGPVRRN